MKPTDKYDDIINMPHHRSQIRPSMPIIDRAAQFSPFASLTGYDAAVEETARLTDEKTELTEDAKSILNEKIQMIAEAIDMQPIVSITHFVPDKKKAGGAYVTTVGRVKRIDEYERTVVFSDKNTVRIDQIRDIDGALFNK